MYRTHTCNQLTKKNSKKEVTLCGWVNTIRDHGDLIFVDLRDRYGLTQVVSDPSNSASVHGIFENLHPEYVIQIKGVVRDRPADMVNSKLDTGEIEVLCSEIEVLSESKVPPFEIDQEKKVNEELRMKYRYLDLRHKRLQDNMMMRHKLTHEIRNFLMKKDFIEIETPILIKGTPEGAREYLVPSRVHPGNFYVLPQSPQQLKQLLMVGGYDRYFQVARCFRDEDQRGDRQPEFTQIDIEMSFVEQEDIMEINEGLMIHLAKKLRPDKKILKKPFPRMTWHEAMGTYGSDKPDLRYDLPLTDISDIVEKSEFKVFADTVKNGGIVSAFRMPDYADTPRSYIETKLTPMVKELGAKGLAYIMYKDEKESPILKFLGKQELKDIEKKTGAKKGDVLFFMAGDFRLACECLGALRVRLAEEKKMIPDGVFAFAWVTDFPLFEKDKETGELVSVHHPFTKPKDEDIPLLKDKPAEVRSDAYDIVINGYEIGGGSIRIHDHELQKQMFELLNVTGEEQERKFGHMLKAFEYGVPPHGGIAWGFDRLAMIFCDEPNIREVIAFPKDQRARDLMLDAPSMMPEASLKEANIQLLPKKELE
jgi:aspartyl-tRNA synthetase